VPFAIRSADGETRLFVIDGSQFDGVGGGIGFVSRETADQSQNLFGSVAEFCAGFRVSSGELEDGWLDGHPGVVGTCDADQRAGGRVAWAGRLFGASEQLLLSKSGLELIGTGNCQNLSLRKVVMNSRDSLRWW
jgi:hypothetical protein